MAINQGAPEGKKVKGVADIVFCFDCTGSMQPYIDNVKNNVKTFVNNLSSAENVVEWRIRVMGYRDFFVDDERNNGLHLINNNPFVNTITEVEAQLNALDANQPLGGDDPESTLDALWYAIRKSEWLPNRHKVIVLFTDETTLPVHQTTITELGISDDIALLQQEIMTNRIKLFMFCKTDPVYDIIGATEKAEVVQFANPNPDLKNSDFGNLLGAIAKTVSQLSISDPNAVL